MWIAENSRAVCDREEYLLYYEGTMLDITDRRQAAEELLQLAHHDALTGLANRRLFEVRLKQAMANARVSNKRGVLMYFDLDGFKKVNDTLGHEWGDELLKEVAKRLKNCLRESDTVCRLGGDEFTIVAENVNRTQDATAIANKILNQISQPFSFEGKQATVGVSIGIVFFTGANYDIDKLIRQADAAMYEAKQNRKGTYRFYENPTPHLPTEYL
jgi:diguanylate cyclase (GGDEF)-like protein